MASQQNNSSQRITFLTFLPSLNMGIIDYILNGLFPMPLIENPIRTNLFYWELTFSILISNSDFLGPLPAFLPTWVIFLWLIILCSLHCQKKSQLQIILCCWETVNIANSLIKISLFFPEKKEVKYFTFWIKDSPNIKVGDVRQLKLWDGIWPL